jgi:hypothetical protein
MSSSWLIDEGLSTNLIISHLCLFIQRKKQNRAQRGKGMAVPYIMKKKTRQEEHFVTDKYNEVYV